MNAAEHKKQPARARAKWTRIEDRIVCRMCPECEYLALQDIADDLQRTPWAIQQRIYKMARADAIEFEGIGECTLAPADLQPTEADLKVFRAITEKYRHTDRYYYDEDE